MNYAFLVALKNHYSELQGVEQVVGQPAVYQTAPGGKRLFLFHLFKNQAVLYCDTVYYQQVLLKHAVLT